VSSGPRARANDPAFDDRLEELRRLYEADEAFPNGVAAWEAIGLILGRNGRLLREGEAPCRFPEWINNYLLRTADKIGRLWLGIRPEDDRPLTSMVNEIGELRKVQQMDRFRDDRISHLASALGFVRQGVSAFRRHDRTVRDAEYLKIYDDPDLEDNKPHQQEVRQALVRVVMRNEGISTEEAVKNRLSKARKARRSRPKGT
jgi:hypothetical protein